MKDDDPNWGISDIGRCYRWLGVAVLLIVVGVLGRFGWSYLNESVK